MPNANPFLKTTSHGLLVAATDALIFANTHSNYFDPGKEHWGVSSVGHAAHAGELLLKSIIASRDPLKIFKNPSIFAPPYKTVQVYCEEAKTHQLHALPSIFQSVFGVDIPDMASFEEIRKARNTFTHLFSAEVYDGFAARSREVARAFIYRNIDPLLKNYFGKYAIEYVDDCVGYDYLASSLVREEIKFSVPPDFRVYECDLNEDLKEVSKDYRMWFLQAISATPQAESMDH